MEQLPGELVAHVCACLEVAELKSIRLCCKAYADVGQSYLFHDFEFKLWPSSKRLRQLGHLADTPQIASKLQVLSCESGIPLEYADYRYWQAQMYAGIGGAWSQSLSAKGTSINDGYEAFHSGLHARFTQDLASRYDSYRLYLDLEYESMANRKRVQTLARTLNVLFDYSPAVQFKLIMSEPQISLEDLESFDPSQHQLGTHEAGDYRRRVSCRRQSCLYHFSNFLQAVDTSHYQVTHLDGINVPHQLLSSSAVCSEELIKRTFSTLTHLSLKVGTFPHSDWLSRGGLLELYRNGRNPAARRLRICLDDAVNLHALCLEFPEGKEAEYSFDIFNTWNLDRFPRRFLDGLRHLDLCRFRCSWDDLCGLLLDAKSLGSLCLSYCRLETGSMIDLLHFIPTLRLASITIGGKWYVDEDSGEWHAHTAEDFSDCFANTTYEGPYENNGMKRRVEEYMLCADGRERKRECPLPRWTPQGREEDFWELKGDSEYPPRLRQWNSFVLRLPGAYLGSEEIPTAPNASLLY